jgi:hypothetical protein
MLVRCGLCEGCRCDGVRAERGAAFATAYGCPNGASLAAFCYVTPRFGGPRDISAWEMKSRRF